MVSDAEFVVVNVVEFAFFAGMGAFYAWLSSDFLKQMWDDKMAKRRLKRARKAEAKGEYFPPYE